MEARRTLGPKIAVVLAEDGSDGDVARHIPQPPCRAEGVG
jgi:hypothetical protein